MTVPLPSPRITAVRPAWAVEGGRVSIGGQGFDLMGPRLPDVQIGTADARLVHASSHALTVVVPPGLAGGRAAIRVGGLTGETAFIEVGSVLATGLHQVDNPVFDREGNLYVTYSGKRGERVPVSIFRVRPDGVREPFTTEITNATSLALDARDRLYVSSRFNGTVHRIGRDGQPELVAADLGVPCGLAFGPDEALYVGDRSGSILRLDSEAHTAVVATLPPSVASYHLAFGPDDSLYVTAPTLASQDSVYRVSLDGRVVRLFTGFGRPQGLAFDHQGYLYVVEALAGSSGLFRLRVDGAAGSVEQVLAGTSLVGVALDPRGGLVVASNDTIYRLDVGVRAP